MYMDSTAQNIKSIIKPYEDKIRQLEEIIKQKDFEIIVLKQKLNNNNLININMNQMYKKNMMVGNIDNINQQMNKEIQVIIKSENKQIDIVSCLENDKISILMRKLNINDCALTFNYKPIDYDLTLKEAGIRNNSLINIQHIIYSITFNNSFGSKSIINLDGDCPLNIAIAFYGIKSQIIDIFQKVYNKTIIFLFDGYKLDVNDEIPVKKIFGFTDHPRVLVNYTNCL